jgi:nucleoid DNA-binding protein
MHARNARNPKTGEKVFLDPHTKITFKPAPSFKKGIKA